jgi:hypothetical protein
VEDLVNVSVDVIYTHITYETKDKLYEGELKPNKYFTHVGFIEAVSENLSNLQFVDGRAVFHLIDIAMVEIPKPYDIDAMLKTIDDQQKEISILRDVIDRGQLFDVRILDQYTLVDPIIGNREIDGIEYNLYEIKDPVIGHVANDGYMQKIMHKAGTVMPFQRVGICMCNVKNWSYCTYITEHIIIPINVGHIMHFADRNSYCNMQWGPFGQPHICGKLEWLPSGNAAKDKHCDLFVTWFMYNIHILYRRYIKVIYGNTLRIYVSVNREQPYEHIWTVGGGKPLIIENPEPVPDTYNCKPVRKLTAKK